MTEAGISGPSIVGALDTEGGNGQEPEYTQDTVVRYGGVRYPVLTWLVDFVKPQRVVDLGTTDPAAFYALCEALERQGRRAKCVAVDSIIEPGNDAVDEWSNDALYTRFGPWAQMTQTDGTFGVEDIDVLRIDGRNPSLKSTQYIDEWLAALRPGGVVILTDDDALNGAFRRHLCSKYPAVTLPDIRITIAQFPQSNQGTSLVGTLEAHPTLQVHLSLVAECDIFRHLFGSGPRSAMALDKSFRQQRDEWNDERESYRRGLTALREEIERLLEEHSRTLDEITRERNSRLDEIAVVRADVSKEYEAEIDSLLAKIAITAGRSELQLTRMEETAAENESIRQSEVDRRQNIELQLASALRELEDVRNSTSWRLGAAAVRLAGRPLRRLRRAAHGVRN